MSHCFNFLIYVHFKSLILGGTFSNFILSRIVNDKLPDDISILDGNRAKLKGLSYQYLDKGFGETLPSEVALLFSIYKNYSYAEKYKESVSEAFTSLVISKAYLE